MSPIPNSNWLPESHSTCSSTVKSNSPCLTPTQAQEPGTVAHLPSPITLAAFPLWIPEASDTFLPQAQLCPISLTFLLLEPCSLSQFQWTPQNPLSLHTACLVLLVDKPLPWTGASKINYFDRLRIGDQMDRPNFGHLNLGQGTLQTLGHDSPHNSNMAVLLSDLPYTPSVCTHFETWPNPLQFCVCTL